jgi:molybdate-binding protein
MLTLKILGVLVLIVIVFLAVAIGTVLAVVAWLEREREAIARELSGYSDECQSAQSVQQAINDDDGDITVDLSPDATLPFVPRARC